MYRVPIENGKKRTPNPQKISNLMFSTTRNCHSPMDEQLHNAKQRQRRHTTKDGCRFDILDSKRHPQQLGRAQEDPKL